MTQIDPKLLEILACPACGGDIELKNEKIVCLKCGRKYPIKNGIPVLLADQAEQPPTGGSRSRDYEQSS